MSGTNELVALKANEPMVAIWPVIFLAFIASLVSTTNDVAVTWASRWIVVQSFEDIVNGML